MYGVVLYVYRIFILCAITVTSIVLLIINLLKAQPGPRVFKVYVDSKIPYLLSGFMRRKYAALQHHNVEK